MCGPAQKPDHLAGNIPTKRRHFSKKSWKFKEQHIPEREVIGSRTYSVTVGGLLEQADV